MLEITDELIAEVDSDGMFDLIRNFPDFWAEAIDFTTDLTLSFDHSDIREICFAGMGGSAIGADLIRAYSYKVADLPIQVIRHYDIPEWVNEQTLFIACSYSGNTEETLKALSQAQQRGAAIIVVTSGGQLLLNASRDNLDYIKIPGGIPPRAALAYSFVPLFRIFQKMNLLDEGDDALNETHELLLDQAEIYADYENNEALELARQLQDSLPIIYSDATLMEPVNLRWRGQMEENAKTLAYGNNFPEMNHNEIVGWEQIAHLTGRLSVVILKDRDDAERVLARMNITKELIEDKSTSITVLNTFGKSRLARMFSLIQMADWTSLYLALLTGVDPSPVAPIDLLKSKLAEFS